MPTITTSRSALEFMRRHGLVETPRANRPRFDATALLVHTMPLDASQLDANQMLDAAGDPPPDRGVTGAWPPAQEVPDDVTAASESA